MVALEFAPVSSVLMCSAAAAAAAMIEHPQAMMLMLLASYFYPVLPSPLLMMTTSNHRFFQMVSFVLVPVDNFDTVDMDYSIVGSKEIIARKKEIEIILNDSFLCLRLPPFDFA